MCIAIVACDLGVIDALYQMRRRSAGRSLKKPKFNDCHNESIKGFEDSLTGSVVVNRSNSAMTTNNIRPSLIRKRDSALAHHHTQEEIKFARLMAILSIFYVICWLPQLVSLLLTLLYFLAAI